MTDAAGQADTLALLRARVTPWGRWSARLPLALIPAAGGAILLVAAQDRDEVPLAVWILGFVVLLLGVWMSVECWRAGRETLRVGRDGSLRVHSPTLLKRDLVIEPSNVSRVRRADAANVPAQAATLTFFTQGDYLRIDLVEPIQLQQARAFNYLWAMRESRDPWPVPLRHRTVRSLGFVTNRADAEIAVDKVRE